MGLRTRLLHKCLVPGEVRLEGPERGSLRCVVGFQFFVALLRQVHFFLLQCLAGTRIFLLERVLLLREPRVFGRYDGLEFVIDFERCLQGARLFAVVCAKLPVVLLRHLLPSLRLSARDFDLGLQLDDALLQSLLHFPPFLVECRLDLRLQLRYVFLLLRHPQLPCLFRCIQDLLVRRHLAALLLHLALEPFDPLP